MQRRTSLRAAFRKLNPAYDPTQIRMIAECLPGFDTVSGDESRPAQPAA
jgi:hypothetical protein